MRVVWKNHLVPAVFVRSLGDVDRGIAPYCDCPWMDENFGITSLRICECCHQVQRL